MDAPQQGMPSRRQPAQMPCTSGGTRIRACERDCCQRSSASAAASRPEPHRAPSIDRFRAAGSEAGPGTMYRGVAAAAAAGSMHPSREDHAASGRIARGSMHAMALPGRGVAASSHAGTSAQGLTDAGSAGPDAAALGQQPLAHAIAQSVRDKAAHAWQEQPAQAGQRQGGGLGGPSAAGERSVSASRWAAFQSCGGAAQICGPVSGLQRGWAAQPGPPEGADYAFSELEG